MPNKPQAERGLVHGLAPPGTREVRVAGRPVPLGRAGAFLFLLDPEATDVRVTFTLRDGSRHRETLQSGRQQRVEARAPDPASASVAFGSRLYRP